MSLKREIAKSNLFFTIGRIASSIIGFFFSIILARLLQPHDFGLYSFALVVVSFFVILTDLGMNSTLTRFTANYLSKKEYGKVKSLIELIFKYKIILIFLVGILVSLLSNEIATFAFNKPEAGFVVFLSGLLLMVNSLFDFLHHLFSGLKNFAFVSAIQISENAFKFVIVLALVISGMAVMGAVLGLILTYTLLVVISTVTIYKKYNFIISEKGTWINRRVLLSFNAWVLLTSMGGMVYGLIDQMMISNMLAIENLGFYKIALTWRWSIVYLVPIASYVMYPYFSGALNKRQLNLMFYNSLRYGSMFIFPLAFLLSAYSGPLILFLYKEPFLPAASALSILAFASIYSVLGSVLMSFFTSIKRPDIVTKVLLLMIMLNIILNYFLIQLYGINGAAIATLISVFSHLVIIFLIAILVKKMMFKLAIILKPLVASVITYVVSLYFLPNVTNYFTLAFYGILSLGVYIIVMLLIRGVTKQDFVHFKNSLKSLF